MGITAKHKKKVVLTIGSLEMGGAERQAFILADYLRRKCQFDVTIAGVGDPGSLADLCRTNNIKCISLPLPLDKNAGFFTNLKKLLIFRRIISGCKPDLIISYTSLLNFPCALVWRFTGAKACIWSQRDEGLGLGHIKFPFLCRLSSFFVSNSKHAAVQLEKFAIPKKRITVIRNGVEIPDLSHSDHLAVRADLRIAPNAKVVCMIGNIHPLKDHETLIRSWSIVSQRCVGEPDPILLLVGREDETDDLKHLVSHYKLGTSVRFLGHVDNISRLLQAVDIGVFSSHTEGLPNGVLECMAMKLPVVATDLPGIREAMGVEYKTECLACSGDFQSMAEKVILLMENETLGMQIGNHNRSRIKHYFTSNRMGEEYVELIKSVLS